jgi:hypothetical protein
VAAAVAAAVVALTAGSAGAAAATTPCWKKVQQDWYRHGRVVGHYKLLCYLQAIKHLPADVATYGGATQDIRRAYLAEKKRLAKIAAAKKAKAKKKTH